MRRTTLCTIVLCSVLVPLVRPATTTAAPITPAGRPGVDLAAFRGQGRLAFLWGDRLYVLDGDAGTLWALPQTGPLGDLSWSPDGHWLAYIAANPTMGAGPLWLVRFDGRRAHQVMGLPATVQAVPWSPPAWSPVADALAAILSWNATPPSGLWLVSPTGRPNQVASAATGVAWSQDGKMLAYSARPRAGRGLGEALWTAPAAGGRAGVVRDRGRRHPRRRLVAEWQGRALLA